MADEPTAGVPEPAPAPEPTPAPEPAAPVETSWRDTLSSDDAKDFAKTSPDVKHLVDRAVVLQKQVSVAIVPPGKDASTEDVASYHKQIGVPATAEDYVFVMPEGQEPTENDKAFQVAMAKVLYEAETPADKAAILNAGLNEFNKSVLEAQIVADKVFADATEVELHKDWPGEEFNINKGYAKNAETWMFGDKVEEVRHLEMKDGRYVMDNPIMLRALASVGREMAKRSQVPATEGEREAANSELTNLRAQQAQAQSEGNTREANRLYQKEQELIAKTSGDGAIVGSSTRAA